MIILCLEGTWAKDPWGILGDVVSRVDVPAIRISYPEQYGASFSYAESVYIGRRALRRKIDRLSEPFVLVGYSQGAHIAGDVAYEYRDDHRLLAVYLIADPKRSPRDTVIGENPGGWGIFGPRYIGEKAKHFVAHGDIIAACTNHFLTNVAFYTIEKKRAGMRDWLKSFGHAAAFRQKGGSLRRAICEVKYYLKTSVHTKYGEMEVLPGVTVTQWIAEDIKRLMRSE